MNFLELVDSYNPIFDRLIRQSKNTEYSAMFLEPNPDAITGVNGQRVMSEMRKVYLMGIMERAHLSSITFIARTQRWISACADSKKSENVLGFASSLRGFLESAADAHDLMQYLPSTLEQIFPYVYLVFKDSNDVSRIFFGFEDLEAKLIHYAYARRKPKGAEFPPHHENKSNAAYIESIEKFGALGAKTLYAELCELTHPAAASVSCFIDETPTTLTFNPDRDHEIIDSILLRYEKTIENIMQFSVNPALISLSFLRRMYSDWHAPTDSEIGPIGNVGARLARLDTFVATYTEGSWGHAQLTKGLNSLPLLKQT